MHTPNEPSREPSASTQQGTLPGLNVAKIVQPFRFPASPYEYKVTPLRECAMPDTLCDQPSLAVDYWRRHVPTHPYFNPEVECLVVLILNTRRRVKGHYLVATGILDTLLSHPREVFRVAVVTAASAIIVMHNHPSGVPTPSEADIRVTRDLVRAGQIMKIELLDHIIVGSEKHQSLRELGYFLS
jgi:DNA repair protein RadC